MSKSATGRVIDKEHGEPIQGLGAFLEDASQVHDFRFLNKPVFTDKFGKFSFDYAEYQADPGTPGRQVRSLRLTIRLGQLILMEVDHDEDPSGENIEFGDLKLFRGEATSWQATLGAGTPSRVTQGNAIRWLADNVDAWGHAAQVIRNATSQNTSASPRHLDVMQLQIDVDFNRDPKKEQPLIVLDFDAKDKPSGQLLALQPTDGRIEQLFLAASKRGVDVRIQIPRMSIDSTAPVFVGIAAALVAGALVFAWVGIIVLAGAILLFEFVKYLLQTELFHKLFNEPDLVQWFQQAGPDASLVRVRELKLRSVFVTHAKMVIDRGQEAVLLGSPFEQVYFDSLQHDIDSPKRGRKALKGPIHDVSVAVRGPAVGDLQDLFNLHWNIADPKDQIPTVPIPGPQTPGDGEFAASVQVVRTLDQQFAEATKGEKGILEAYLRAIFFADRFIYLENQYFNQHDITNALILALAAKPALVVILFLNVSPDMNLYPGWQKQEIDKIVQALGGKAAADKRFGVFTSWSHTKTDGANPKPRLVDNYLHTKSAIVDNHWATVGSANLDGASLDYVQYAHQAIGDVRNSEANLVVLEAPNAQNSAVDALRRRLWSEHLGISDPNSADLSDASGKNWLDFWRQKAKEKLDGLQSNLDAVSPIHVLPLPSAPYELTHSSHAAAKSYLDQLFSPDEKPSDVLESQFNLLQSGPPSFTFKSTP
jgi:phosphatidylserine/phosphatidylglycerophosphate/cardiolipin synthase-like enzyme